jgi:hypothetical protein
MAYEDTIYSLASTASFLDPKCHKRYPLSKKVNRTPPFPSISLTQQLFILGIFLPVLPWVYAAAVFLFLPSVKVKDIEKQEEEGVVVVEGRYWAWVCVFGLAVEALLAAVVGGIVLYDMGLLHG